MKSIKRGRVSAKSRTVASTKKRVKPAPRAREAAPKQAPPKPAANGNGGKPPLTVAAGGAKIPAQVSAADVTGKLKESALSKTSLKTLKEQFKAGQDAEDDALLVFASKVRENIRLELLIESEETRAATK